jgi:hypothetical protein
MIFNAQISRFSHLDLLKQDFKNAESLEIKNKSRDFKISRIYFIIEIQNPETKLTFMSRDLRFRDFASRDGFSRFISRW